MKINKFQKKKINNITDMELRLKGMKLVKIRNIF